MIAQVLCVFVLGILEANSYVLVQVRKSNNQSDVDALIHKVVPRNIELDKTARKHFSNDNKNTDKKYRKGDDVGNVIIAINTDDKKTVNTRKSLKKENVAVDEFVNNIVDFFNSFLDDAPNYRSKTEPEIVHFRSGKSSKMYQINTDTILSMLQELLASKKFRKYADTFANKAAIVYRAIKEEMNEE